MQSGRGEQTAILYDSPVTGGKRAISYATLLEEVQACALMLRDLGVGIGDRVILSMPMVPEALIGMLACARIGAVHSVVFGGFAARELAARIDDAAPRVILSASCGVETSRLVLYKPLPRRCDRAGPAQAGRLHHPAAAAMRGRDDRGARSRLAGASRRRTRVAALRAPLGLRGTARNRCALHLYTSGTTGRPKGVVRDNGGTMVALRWSMTAIYGMQPGEVFWAASDVGWVVGHSYILYGPLLAGCTTILYEGKPVGTPDAGAYWRVIASMASRCCSPRPPRCVRSARPTTRAGCSRGTI